MHYDWIAGTNKYIEVRVGNNPITTHTDTLSNILCGSHMDGTSLPSYRAFQCTNPYGLWGRYVSVQSVNARVNGGWTYLTVCEVRRQLLESMMLR